MTSSTVSLDAKYYITCVLPAATVVTPFELKRAIQLSGTVQPQLREDVLDMLF